MWRTKERGVICREIEGGREGKDKEHDKKSGQKPHTPRGRESASEGGGTKSYPWPAPDWYKAFIHLLYSMY